MVDHYVKSLLLARPVPGQLLYWKPPPTPPTGSFISPLSVSFDLPGSFVLPPPGSQTIISNTLTATGMERCVAASENMHVEIHAMAQALCLAPTVLRREPALASVSTAFGSAAQWLLLLARGISQLLYKGHHFARAMQGRPRGRLLTPCHVLNRSRPCAGSLRQ